MKNEHIHGGMSDKNPESMFSKKQLKMGQSVEMEHTNKPSLAREIARDHLIENPKYYDYLDAMEKKMDKDWSKWYAVTYTTRYASHRRYFAETGGIGARTPTIRIFRIKNEAKNYLKQPVVQHSHLNPRIVRVERNRKTGDIRYHNKYIGKGGYY